jgi:hypothetical protein
MLGAVPPLPKYVPIAWCSESTLNMRMQRFGGKNLGLLIGLSWFISLYPSEYIHHLDNPKFITVLLVRLNLYNICI